MYRTIFTSLLFTACTCEIDRLDAYQHFLYHDVLVFDETYSGISAEDSLLTKDAIDQLYSELSTDGLVLLSRSEIHIREDQIACLISNYRSCHGCAAVAYLSNGAPLVYLSNKDRCSVHSLIKQELSYLINDSLGYYIEKQNLCGTQLECSLARDTTSRQDVWNDICIE